MKYRASSYADGVYDVYYYEKNLQGDIIAVYGDDGTKYLEYTYDAYGSFTIGYYNAGNLSSAVNNPFTYRGYYYDDDLGLYYLNSRYYDSDIGRWLNADGQVSGVGGDIRGYNLFAYCFNNPIKMIDTTGNWPIWNDIKDGLKNAGEWICDNVKNAGEWVCDNVVKPVAGFVEDVWEDIQNYDSNNQSEEVVFSSNYFSNYKGVLVIKTPFDASFSFGFIGLSTQQQDVNTLKHEYGHSLQMEKMGVGKYISDVFIPSVTINILDRKDKLPYDYYSYPWEAEANELGGAKLSQSGKPALPQGGYTSYWDLLKLFLNRRKI